jgi:hypothetical protein
MIFVDTSAFLAMERLEVKTAFTFYAHFKEYGKLNISP